jgi:hypothetical protein
LRNANAAKSFSKLREVVGGLSPIASFVDMKYGFVEYAKIDESLNALVIPFIPPLTVTDRVSDKVILVPLLLPFNSDKVKHLSSELLDPLGANYDDLIYHPDTTIELIVDRIKSIASAVKK